MANIQIYNLTYTEWKAKTGTAYYINTSTAYIVYKVDSTLANQIIWATKIFYAPPLTSTQSANLSDFNTTVLGTATQVFTVDEVVSANF
jgi:hypothetical protein